MIAAMIEGWHRICGKAQGYKGLPIRDMRFPDGTPVMVTAWTPTERELKMLRDGANINVYIIGNIPPPMMVEVGILDGLTDKPRT